jgi:amidase
MTQSVLDAARVLSAMAGSDPADPATERAMLHAGDFTGGLENASLSGLRIGVLRNAVGDEPGTRALFEAALADMQRAGAVLVDIEYTPQDRMYEDEFTVLLYELREDLGAYLSTLPGNPPVRSLADVIAFNTANADTELRWFGQEIFEQAEKTRDRAAYETARETSLRLAGEEGIDRLLKAHEVEVLIAPTTGPAWPIDLIYGDNYPGSIGAGSLAAIAGYPHLSVPMGAVEGLPVGLSIMGGKWEDRKVLRAGAAFEKVRTALVPTPDLK